MNVSSEILKELESISQNFSLFQEKSGLSCVESCGRCCFKADIYASPIELLPMAMELLNRGEAQDVYEKCLEFKGDHCLLLEVMNQEKFQGRCKEYQHRPLVCRTFGVSARHGKMEKIEFSVCKTLKEEKKLQFNDLVSKEFSKDEALPFIDLSKSRLGTLDPQFLAEEFPIHIALKMTLEKVLLAANYSPSEP